MLYQLPWFLAVTRQVSNIICKPLRDGYLRIYTAYFHQATASHSLSNLDWLVAKTGRSDITSFMARQPVCNASSVALSHDNTWLSICRNSELWPNDKNSRCGFFSFCSHTSLFSQIHSSGLTADTQPQMLTIHVITGQLYRKKMYLI